jgi:hypothetical protein
LCRHFLHKGPNTKLAVKVSVGSCIPSRPCDRTKERDSSGESLGLGGSSFQAPPHLVPCSISQ